MPMPAGVRLGKYQIIAPLGEGASRALKASIPKGRLDGLVASARVLSPAALLAMVSDVGAAGSHGTRPNL